MPFLTTINPSFHKTKFYILHGIAPNIEVNEAIQKMAQCFAKQKKKVLIFDALLGLKNFPVINKKQSKIPAVFNRQEALSELVTNEKGIDIITGSAQQNLLSLPQKELQYIKFSLKQLAQNYDTVFIDVPSYTIASIWDDMGENLWVIPPDKNIICRTLKTCANIPQPHLVLYLEKSENNLNQIYAFIKILRSDCQITFF